MRLLRIVVGGFVITGVYWFGWAEMWSLWGKIVMAWGTYTDKFDWLDPAYALLWAFALLLGVFVGCLLQLLTWRFKPLWPALVLGLIYGGLTCIRSGHYFGEGATLSSYIWSYGTYLMVPIGAIVGAAILAGIRQSFQSKMQPNYRVERTRDK